MKLPVILTAFIFTSSAHSAGKNEKAQPPDFTAGATLPADAKQALRFKDP